ncbi:MAG: TIGR01459 family HAD-type hydrolase [Paracoccaceae bacterium]
MPVQIIQNLAEISAEYDAVFCDIWGCFHDGITPFPAAVAACQGFRARGGHVILLTNAPRPGASVKQMLDKMGAPEESYDAIVSSGGACQAAMTSGRFGSRFHHVGPSRDNGMLSDVGLQPATLTDASAILLTGLRDDMTETPEDYRDEIANWCASGLPVLCANPDIIVDRGEMRLWCAGSLAQIHEEMGGEVVWFGKPHTPVYDRCHEVLAELTGMETPHNRILAIGDGILTDVPGGINAGLDTIFVTGGLSASDFGSDVENPEQAPLDAFLVEKDLKPRYAIGRLR